MAYIKRSCRWKYGVNWAVLWIGLLSGSAALAAFTDDIAEGLDNNSFYYLSNQEFPSEPSLVLSEGVNSGDAVRVGGSAGSGFYFAIEGPGTLTFQWRVDGEEIIGGKGTYLEYQLLDQSFSRLERGVITGNTSFQQVEFSVPAGANTFYATYISSSNSARVGQDAGWIDQLVWTPAAPPADTTPDAFSFNAQTSVSLSTVVPSNTIAISGIDAAADIGITGCSSTCEYSINAGTWTSSAGTAAVSNGDSIGVRQTSSGSYATATSLTLDIGGVTAPFDVTTEPAPAPDTTPDAFSFTGQNNVPLSEVIASNTIGISGINAAADIGITGCSSTCEYSINGGAWTSSAGAAAVSNGGSIGVRQTSSPSYATSTSLTLDIGGVTASFDVTTEPEPEPVPVVVGPTSTGTGVASAFVEAVGNSAPGCNVSEAAFLAAPVAPPEGVTLPHGMFGFTSTGCTEGFSVDVTVEYPSDIPAGASYWKYDEGIGWYTIPATIVGNTVSFTITDDGMGDSNSAAGAITDPGGIGLGNQAASSASASAQAIPTMTWWSLVALIVALTTLAMFSMRRGTA